jgi:DNA-binding beta-propeller fold protein YncE
VRAEVVRRRLWRPRGFAILIIVLSGCGTVATSPSPRTSTVPAPRSSPAESHPSPVGNTVPCSTATASAPTLANVQFAFSAGLFAPFGVSIATDDDHAFVAALTPMQSYAASTIDEFGITSSGLVRQGVGIFGRQPMIGLALARDGRYLIAAGGGGASVFSVKRIEDSDGPSSWLLGSLDSPGQGGIETVASPDGNYLFVSMEDSDNVAVFDLGRALAHGFRRSDFVGFIPLGVAPVGLNVSTNGLFLYATSEAAAETGGEGTLTTIDLRHAEHDPSRSIVSTVWAGCSPVRVTATPSTVYVTARGSDQLLAFSADALVSRPASALEGEVQVGEAPVGEAVVDGGKAVIVADSNRFQVGQAPSNLAVVTVTGNGSLSLVGYVPTGGFPRDMTVSPDGKTLLVSDYQGDLVEDVAIGTIPA